MKTPQQIRNEVEKGCGKVTNWYELKRLCGTFEDLKHSEHIILCPSCQAKLSILTEYDKSIKEMIEERVNFYKKLWLKAVDEQNKHQEDIFYNTYFNLKELLSKIGDVQQTSEEKQDDRWDKEYNPDLLPETLKNKEEKQDE